MGKAADVPLVLDGELVALDKNGAPTGFQKLQGRIHLIGSSDVERVDRDQPVALILFDLLRDGDDDLRGLPLAERRTRLEARLKGHLTSTLRLSEQIAGDGRAMHERAKAEGWEGLIAKSAQSVYQSGRRSPNWMKSKLVKQQEFVVGGWTEPRQTRQYFGALLLGVHKEGDPSGKLTYVGHTGTGFDQRELERVSKLLKSREIAESPFAERFKTNEPAHWARPDLVAQVRFTEWTADGKLRHPVYLGLRDDKKAAQVVREQTSGTRGRGRESPEPERPSPEPRRPAATRAGAPARRQADPSSRRRGAVARARGCAEGRCGRAAGWRPSQRHESRESLLAGSEADEGRPPPLLRDGRATDPACHRRIGRS